MLMSMPTQTVILILLLLCSSAAIYWVIALKSALNSALSDKEFWRSQFQQSHMRFQDAIQTNTALNKTITVAGRSNEELRISLESMQICLANLREECQMQHNQLTCALSISRAAVRAANRGLLFSAVAHINDMQKVLEGSRQHAVPESMSDTLETQNLASSINE